MTSQDVVEDIFDKVERTASQSQDVSVGDLLDTFGNRVYGPVIFVVGVLAASPLGMIPGASVLFASMVILVAAQYALNSGSPWLPDALLERRVDADRAHGALEKMRPYARKVEFLFSERATSLASSPWTLVWAAIMFALALAMYPLALVPGGVFAPAVALALLGLAMTARDGVMLGISGGLGVLACLGGAFAIV